MLNKLFVHFAILTGIIFIVDFLSTYLYLQHYTSHFFNVPPTTTVTYTDHMDIAALEAQDEARQTSEVLAYLEAHGICEPAIATGWTRTLVAGGATNDIDISYVGPSIIMTLDKSCAKPCT